MIFTLLSTLPVLIITSELDYAELSGSFHNLESITSNAIMSSHRNCTRDTDIIDQLLNGTGYNKFRIPQDEGMAVVVEIWIQAITAIDELTNDFDMDIYITETWLDPALNFQNMSPCKGNLSLNHQVLDRLWTPNSCFINSKVAQIHNSPFRSVFLMLFPNGTVMVNYRVRVKGPCQLDLSNFPLDLQRCSLIYESFNYNHQEVEMKWSEISIQILAPIVLPDFDLFKVQTEGKQESYPAGMWDELHVTLVFERRFIWYFMQAYLPTYLTIFISWVSFALGPRAIPARTMLGVNSLLAIVFQFGNIMRNLPRVSYIKGIDVWMLVSMTFIFCSLLELAIVGYMVRDEPGAKKKPVKKLSREESPHGITTERRFMFPPGCTDISLSKTSLNSTNCMTSCWTPERIDSLSSFMFPFTFFVFNIIYWVYYIYRKEIIRAQMVADHGKGN
ncbi:unnamed protein product [Caenorhabditis angaria]|uniref:Uncharacterized protein n=1 Tax=Caenorhabditis angaria TaxID=860376 RepID=A0A9P1ISV2_9PELO|nr:unnamed protein product [Caenorhabditis angaria]